MGRGAEGLETAVVGGVNPTHYNSSLWPVLGKGLQGPTATSYQYVFPLFHLSKWPLTAPRLTSLSLSVSHVSFSVSLCQYMIPLIIAGTMMQTCDKRCADADLRGVKHTNVGVFCTELNCDEEPHLVTSLLHV